MIPENINQCALLTLKTENPDNVLFKLLNAIYSHTRWCGT